MKNEEFAVKIVNAESLMLHILKCSFESLRTEKIIDIIIIPAFYQ